MAYVTEANMFLGRYLKLQLGDTNHVFENTVLNGSVNLSVHCSQKRTPMFTN